MTKNKYKTNKEFIRRLLIDETPSNTETQQIWGLATKYFANEIEAQKDEIELLKKEVETKTKKDSKQNSKEGVFHAPLDIVNCLAEFTNDNYPVKWLVHAVDRPEYQNYEDIIDPVKDSDNYRRWIQVLNYDKDLWWDVIYPFVFQSKLNSDKEGNEIPYGWGRNNIKIGWQYPDHLKKWCEINMNNKAPENRRYPFEMDVPRSLKPPRGVNTFEDVVREFNKEIRYERNNLSMEIDRLGVDILKQHSLVNNLERVPKLYVHTWKVQNAIKRIFRMIHWRTENNNVEVFNSFNEDRTTMFLRILHVNSQSPSAPNDSAIDGSNGDLREVIESLKNVCDFSIEGNFVDPTDTAYKPYRINYLYPGVDPEKNGGTKIDVERLDKKANIKGFTYVLKFYLYKSKQ